MQTNEKVFPFSISLLNNAQIHLFVILEPSRLPNIIYFYFPAYSCRYIFSEHVALGYPPTLIVESSHVGPAPSPFLSHRRWNASFSSSSTSSSSSSLVASVGDGAVSSHWFLVILIVLLAPLLLHHLLSPDALITISPLGSPLRLLIVVSNCGQSRCYQRRCRDLSSIVA